MKTDLQILRANGKIEHRTVELPDEPEYEQLRAIIEPIVSEQRGRPAGFEHVAVLGKDRNPTDMFVDEFGALPPALPINDNATRVYHRASIERGEFVSARAGIIADAPKIHGDAVLFMRRVWF